MIDIKDIRVMNYYTTTLRQDANGDIVIVKGFVKIVKEFVKYDLQILRNHTFAEWEPVKVIEVNLDDQPADPPVEPPVDKDWVELKTILQIFGYGYPSNSSTWDETLAAYRKFKNG